MSRSSIAVIGLGCVYPGAHSVEELWTNILAGRRYFRRSPDERLPDRYYYDPDPDVIDKTYCNRMAVLADWRFNPTDWRIPPITFEQSDIVHWLALHTAAQAIEDAALDFGKTDRRQVGVILGNSGIGEFHRSHLLRNRWPFVERAVRRAVERAVSGEEAEALIAAVRHYYTSPFPEFREDHLAGNMANVIAGRISNYYDFRGPSYTVDGACASSLLAVINACMQLQAGEAEVCLAGGVDISLDPLEIIGFAKTQALAREDIRPYDERAHGMQTGEGCGIVVLATEAYARRYGYRVRALIRGWGVSADGSGGITQPKVEGQRFAVEKAYARAGYGIASVGYIEGHGTGTAVGDKVEITALREAIDAEEPDEGSVQWIGSIKANIGHTKAAAGVAGLIKVVRALERKVIPPHVGCHRPSSAFGKPPGRLRPARGDVWKTEGPRRAAVSAFGFGGANTHLTLEEADPEAPPKLEDVALMASIQASELILLSARSLFELKEKAERLYASARRMCEADVIDAAAALSAEAPAGPFRVAIVTSRPWQLTEQLKTVIHGISEGLTLAEIDQPENGLFAGEARRNPRLAALFPGQGSHRLNMGRHWLRRYDFVREMCRSFDERMFELTGESFMERVFRDLDGADDATRRTWADELRETLFQQPSIVSCSLAALRVLEHFGLRPDYAVGHSLGEISALVAGGALDPLDALHVAALRAQAMDRAAGKGTGGMAAVGLASDELEAFLRANRLDLVISNFNSVRQNVVSGPITEIERAVALAEERKIWIRKLDVSHAFHSPAVAPAAEGLRKALDQVSIGRLDGAGVFSTATGGRLEEDSDLRELLAGQIVRPVRFVEAVRKVAAEGPDLWVEVGPGQVLSDLARTVVGDAAFEAHATDLGGEDEYLPLNRLLGRAFVLGFPVRTDRLFDGRFHRPIDPYHHDPVLIRNPCEREVPAFPEPLSLGGGALPAHVLPEEGGADFAEYLKRRRDFLREMIRLDYRNWPERTDGEDPREDEASGRVAALQVEEDADEAADGKPVIETVIDWIVQRTGYPRDFVTPDKTLRDDLNLDSIKAGELALMLSKKMGRELPLDLGIVANASIEYLVETVSRFEGRRFGMDASTFSRWIRSFGVDFLPASLENEAPVPLPRNGVTWVVGRDGCLRRDAVAAALAAEGLAVETVAVEALEEREEERELAALVLVLPEEDRPFFEIRPSEFKERVEGLAVTLFGLMKKVLNEVVLEREDFRCLVVRPAVEGDPASDLDGAAAFFKTLALEHNKPAWIWKWLTVPAAWDGDALSRVVRAEMERRGERIEYHHRPGGERLSPTAVQIGTDGPPAPRLGALDTILVSGGGKGITFEMAFALARKTGVKLGLIGSSPAPPEGEPEGELAGNLARLRAEAVRHLYVQADVTRHGAVLDAVRKIERKLGRITGILHGAGISRFSEFLDMDLDEYLRCIRIKAAGLYNLLSAVPPGRLKALHVISSVLGRTGMFRQADYTFANAWLDGATRSVLQRFPKIHAFSIGYTVWEETGIGAKSGSLEMLQTVGVTPLPKQDGIAAYLNLATHRHPFRTYVCTGRLSPEVESRLMPALEMPSWRFLEKTLRFVPGVDLVVEARLSHERDRYLPEHVFAGTPLMPTVLGLEAMVQTAMACIGTTEIPAIRDIRLRRPMIVPEESGLRVRVMALVDEPAEAGVTSVRVRMLSESDGFSGEHFEVQCLFGLPAADLDLPAAPPLPDVPDPRSPESFSPEPLFQGPFFRRITKVHRIAEQEETLTEITVPVDAVYYGEGLPQGTCTPSPAIRDAMLQSAALMAPAGYLPEGIEEMRILRPVEGGEKLLCHARARSRDERTLTADIVLYDASGRPVELLRGLLVKAPSTPVALSVGRRTRRLPFAELPDRLAEVAARPAPVISVVEHRALAERAFASLLPPAEREALLRQASPPRRDSVLAGTIAVRRAVVEYAAKHLAFRPEATEVSLRHEGDGKPGLVISGAPAGLEGALDVSIADSRAVSVALVGPRPVGVDLEVVETRDAETWQGLLGLDGYDLARRLQRSTGESFDAEATRVWTLIEAGKKADGLRRELPRFAGVIGDTWLAFVGGRDETVRFASVVLERDGVGFVASLTAPGIVAEEGVHRG